MGRWVERACGTPFLGCETRSVAGALGNVESGCRAPLQGSATSINDVASDTCGVRLDGEGTPLFSGSLASLMGRSETASRAGSKGRKQSAAATFVRAVQ